MKKILLLSFMTLTFFASQPYAEVAPSSTKREPNSRREFKSGQTGNTSKKAKTSSKGSVAPSANAKKVAPKSSAQKIVKKPVVTVEQKIDQRFQKALDMVKEGNYQDASMLLFTMSRTKEYESRHMHIKYILGLTLYEMKLYQSAAFQFVDVVRDGNNKYVKKALEKLSLAASILNNDTLLNFALTKIELNEFPKNYHDMLYYRIGEIYRKKNAMEEAVKSFSKVKPGSPWFAKAKYLTGLSLVQMGKLPEGLKEFQELVDERSDKSLTDTSRNAAILGMARVLYQQKKWDSAIEYYRQIPKDSEFWHDTVFEISWAYLRAAQFRSVLSSLHSLHSPYYEDLYLPESILLRSFVYLFICQYDEMEKTLDYFDKSYRPVQRSITEVIQNSKDSKALYDEVAKVSSDFAELRRNKNKRSSYKIPFVVSRTILKEGDFQRTHSYVQKLLEERKKIRELSSQWRKSGIGQYAEKAVLTRLEIAQATGGKQVLAHLNRIKLDLEGLFEQHGFARYELLKGRKENLKKQIAGKGLGAAQVDDSNARDFYISNGFEYWPFEGEYWLDEIGNYHYVGVQSCE
jgi:tetratricopeptide (TPR) repeat protein